MATVASRSAAAAASLAGVATPAADGEAAARELDEWHQLHLRSVSIWMVMIAAATVGGWLL